MIDGDRVKRTRELTGQLLMPGGPTNMVRLYGKLFGEYPATNLSPYQIVDAIVGQELALRDSERAANS